VIRTFSSVFPHLEIWDTDSGDIILLGSQQPWESSRAVLQKGFLHEAVRADLNSLGLGTPEALLARQFASQRTAFAIAGPGPLQTDAFPILEYDAPQAFFVGRNATRLQSYDERTWQSELLGQERRNLLAGLGGPGLKSAFTYGSVNVQLRQALENPERPIFNRSVEGRMDFLSPAMPCVFRTNSLPAIGGSDGQRGPGDRRELLQAERALRAQEGDWKQAVKGIAGLLRRQSAGSFQSNPPWDAAGYASLAARACLRHGCPAQARELIELARQLDPDAEELNYLERIVDRPPNGPFLR
jgi:hypothetical protein